MRNTIPFLLSLQSLLRATISLSLPSTDLHLPLSVQLLERQDNVVVKVSPAQQNAGSVRHYLLPSAISVAFLALVQGR